MKISFLIISYNQKEALARAIQSIRCSGIPKDDYEIIVSDDGSTDGTRSFLVNSKGIKTFLSGKNTKNQSLMRNEGIRRSEGEYIMFLDGDDYFNGVELYKIYKKLNGKDVYLPSALIFDSIYDNSRLINIKIEDVKNPKRRIYHSICNYVVRREFIMENNIFFHEEKYNYENEDMLFTFLVLDRMESYEELDHYAYVYKYSVNSNSSKTAEQFPDFLMYLFELSDYVKAQVEDENLHILIDKFMMHQVERGKRICYSVS